MQIVITINATSKSFIIVFAPFIVTFTSLIIVFAPNKKNKDHKELQYNTLQIQTRRQKELCVCFLSNF